MTGCKAEKQTVSQQLRAFQGDRLMAITVLPVKDCGGLSKVIAMRRWEVIRL